MLTKTIIQEKEELALENKLLKQSDNISIPESHKKIVRERILEAKAKPKIMVDWDEVKNTF